MHESVASTGVLRAHVFIVFGFGRGAPYDLFVHAYSFFLEKNTSFGIASIVCAFCFLPFRAIMVSTMAMPVSPVAFFESDDEVFFCQRDEQIAAAEGRGEAPRGEPGQGQHAEETHAEESQGKGNRRTLRRRDQRRSAAEKGKAKGKGNGKDESNANGKARPAVLLKARKDCPEPFATSSTTSVRSRVQSKREGHRGLARALVDTARTDRGLACALLEAALRHKRQRHQ